nr:phytanoyl-CoA dioxygenase family protein [Propionibacteriaceae bacterium]
MSQTITDLVTPEMLEQYRNEGYFVLEGAMTPDQLELLRGGAQYSM